MRQFGTILIIWHLDVSLQLTDSSALCDAALEHISLMPNIVVLELSDSPEYVVHEFFLKKPQRSLLNQKRASSRKAAVC
jgi:hypothetical protein